METQAPVQALPEVQAAALAGFARWRDFLAARRTGAFPPPDVQLPDGPRWDRGKLVAWLRGDKPEKDSRAQAEQELIRRAGAFGPKRKE